MVKTEPETLCWNCAKALGGCSWSAGEFQPVDGWMALPTCQLELTPQGLQVIESFFIYGCPEYQPDERRRRG